MENQPLQSDIIEITNIELREVKRKDGTSFKQFAVKVKDQEKGVFYTLPIKKADGNFTKAYLVYKENKQSWDEAFAEGGTVGAKIAFSEQEKPWEKNGKSGTNVYRTIRFMEPAQVEVIGKILEKPITDDDMFPEF